MTDDQLNEALDAFNFLRWADDVADMEGVPLVGAQQRQWIAAAAAELRRHRLEAAERSRSARERGRKGGRRRTDNPAPSTERSRKSKAKKAAGKADA